MTDQELCIKVAELCGYRNINYACKAGEAPRMELKADGYVYEIPDYVSSYDACMEAWDKFTSREGCTVDTYDVWDLFVAEHDGENRRRAICEYMVKEMNNEQ